MTRETATIYDEISTLLEEPAERDDDGFLGRLEHTLTDGYARALALEAERVRLEKQMGELAKSVHGGSAEELAAVARRLSDTHSELTQLRGVLRRLKARARAVRAA